MVVTDDPNNPPDTEKVAMTFHLRLRRDCELPVIKEKLIERHPLLANMISVLYFIDEGKLRSFEFLEFLSPKIVLKRLFFVHFICIDGCRTTLFNHRIKSFWKYFENLRDATACIYVNAMMFKHPTKLCTNCSGNIYGIIYTCGRCERHASCLQCVNNGTARCAMHGNFYLTSVTIPMPANISVSWFKVSSVKALFSSWLP